MHVAVAMVGYKNDQDIVSCLEALGNSTHLDFEVVICENGGAAAFETLKERVSEVLPRGQTARILQATKNLGFAGGVNLCMRESSGADAWWVLNPDTLPRPNALEAMIRRLSLADCDAVGSAVYLTNGRVQSYGGHWSPWIARAVSIGRGAPVRGDVDPMSIERRQNYLNGASMLIGRRFRDAVGPMREDYFLYCEEVEWCLRGLKRGMKLGFANDAIVVHAQGSTTGAGEEFPRRSRMPVYLHERNKILLTRDLFPLRLPFAMPAVLLTLFVRAARSGAWRQFGYGFSGWISGILNVRGAPAWMQTEFP